MNKNFILIFFLSPLFLSAQVVSDAKLWAGISVNKSFNDLTISFTEEMRLDENISHIDKILSEIGAQYKITKGFYIGLNYRYSRDNDYETKNYDMKHRIDFGLTYKRKLNDFRFSFRTKIQSKSALPNENNPTFSRNKFALKYKLNKKVIPFIAYEFYYQFNDQKVINRTRYSLGTSYKINSNNALKLFYLFETRFNTRNLKYNHIYGISYSIDI